jgi:hypothetical protein
MAARNISLGWEIPAYGVDCDITQGEAATLTFTKATTTDVTTWTITGYLKQFHDSATVALALTAGSLTSAGVFVLTLTGAQTQSLVNQSYQLQVWRTTAGSETLLSVVTVNVLEGQLTLP